MIRIPKWVPKESYAFVFPSAREARYWMMQTHIKLFNEILFQNKRKCLIEFEDCTYYFVSQYGFSRLKGIHFNYVYPGVAIPIILDDPERLRTEENCTDA